MDKLIVKKGCISAMIVDEELDPIDCTFNNDDCVVIDTEGYAFITLSLENLETLENLIYDAHAKYKRMEKREEEKELKQKN